MKQKQAGEHAEKKQRCRFQDSLPNVFLRAEGHMLKCKTEPSVRNSKRKTHRLVAEISWRPNVVWRNKRRWTKQGITHLSPVVYTAAKCSTAGFPSVFST